MGESFIIFCDGASKHNPGPAGWGAVVVYQGRVSELGGFEARSTNNRMELKAAAESLKFCRSRGAGEILVYSDSGYVVDGMSKWVSGWQKNGWQTSQKKPVLNRELWQELEGLASGGEKKPLWRHLGGHIGVAGNERADSIASCFAEGKKVVLYDGLLENYGVDILNFQHDAGKLEEKKSGRAASGRAAYSYVSLVDGKIQIHKTWAECETRVKGRPARFKKAVSAEDERKIIADFSGF